MLVLDTNVVSELMRPVPNPVITSWVADRVTSSLFLTAVTEAELRFGLAVMPTGKRRAGLATALERMLERGFANRVLPFDSSTAWQWRRAILGTSRIRGRSLQPMGGCVSGMVKPFLSVEIDALPNYAVWNLSGHVSLPLECVLPDSTHSGYVCG
jgi:predicted nucleic acid-binding protein